MKRITLATVARISGIGYETAKKWVKAGLLKPLEIDSELFDAYAEQDVLACAIGTTLRKKGCSLAQVRRAVGWLRRKKMSTIRAEWEHGQRLLWIIGENEPFYRQWTPAEIFDNPEIDLAAAARLDIPMAVVDLQACWAKIESRIEAIRKAPSRRRSKCV